MKIGVIISVYSGDDAEHFEQSIESLLNQSYSKFDILLYVDGLVGEGINQVIEKHRNSIKYLHHSDKNSGLFTALNHLILNNYTNYDIFVRHDSDDICHKNRLSTIYEYMNLNQNVDVFSSFTKEFHKSIEDSQLCRYPTCRKDRIKAFSYATIFPHVTSAVRSRYFEKVGIYSGLSYNNEDQWLWASGLSRNCNFYTHKEPLVYVRTEGHAIRRANYKIHTNLLLMKMILSSNLKLGVYWRIKLFVAYFSRILPACILSVAYRLIRR